MRGARILAGLAALSLTGAAPLVNVDPENPSCPKPLNFSDYPEMRFTLQERGGMRVLLAEGRIDNGAEARLADALARYGAKEEIHEIWLRSPGGNARVGNAAGRLIRQSQISTRIPSGWACFSACNFLFMGGLARSVEPGGLFVVRMFTHLGDRAAVEEGLAEGADSAIEMIGEVEQGSALLASDDNDFLIRMGVSRKLLTEVMYRQKAIKGSGDDRSTRRCLTEQELIKYGVTNAAA